MKTILLSVFTISLLVSCSDYDPQPRIDYRERVIGYYDVEEWSDTYHEFVSYEMYVSKSRYASDEIFFDDLYSPYTKVSAYLNNDRITIPLQISNGYEFEGTGRVFRGKLELNYSVKDLHRTSYRDFCVTDAFLQ